MPELLTSSIGLSGDRAWRACAVCAPPAVEPRSPRTPYWGCAAGCPVGGASLAPPAHRWSPSAGGGVVRLNGESQQRRRTAPSLRACWPAVTLSNENALSRFQAYRDPDPLPAGPGGPLAGQQQAESEAIGSVVRPTGVVAVGRLAVFLNNSIQE